VWSFAAMSLMNPPNAWRGHGSASRGYGTASSGGGVIGFRIDPVIAGIADEQRYDGFLGKLGHVCFEEDVILAEDSWKVCVARGGKTAGGSLCM